MAAPRKITDEQIAEAKRLQGQGLSLQDIADELGVKKPSIAEALRVAAGSPRRAPRKKPPRKAAAKRAQRPAPLSASPSPHAPLPSPEPPLPQGGPVPRADVLALVRRILGARNAAALEELDVGLAVATRGPDELDAWLARPIAPAVVDDDPLVTLREALALAVGALRTAAPGAITLRTISAVESLATRLERVTLGRPRETSPDEVRAAIETVHDDALDLVQRYTGEADVDYRRRLASCCAPCRATLTAAA